MLHEFEAFDWFKNYLSTNQKPQIQRSNNSLITDNISILLGTKRFNIDNNAIYETLKLDHTF